MSSNITAALKAQADKNAAAEAKRQAAAAFKQSLMAMDTFRKVTHTHSSPLSISSLFSQPTFSADTLSNILFSLSFALTIERSYMIIHDFVLIITEHGKDRKFFFQTTTSTSMVCVSSNSNGYVERIERKTVFFFHCCYLLIFIYIEKVS